MKRFLLVTVLFISISGLVAQPFSRIDKNDLFTKSDIYSLKIGEVTIKDIRRPGNDFAELALLGEPKEIVFNESFAGREFTYKYNGFELYYSTIDGILELKIVRVYGENGLVSLSDVNMLLRVGEPIENYIDNVEAARSFGGFEEVIYLDFESIETEGKEGVFKLDGTIIKEMEFYF